MSLADNLDEARAEIAGMQRLAASRGAVLAAPPEMPDPRTCCGRGCDPCMFTYYFEALQTWRETSLRTLAVAPSASRPE